MRNWGLLVLVLGGCGKVNTLIDADLARDTALDDASCATLDCDDGDACTDDSCTAGACVHTPVAVTHSSQVFSATGAIQTYTPVACVRSVTIDATGGSGGNGMVVGGGGLGAHVVGTFALTAGQTLSVLVGSAGMSAADMGGGGGGSFIWDPTATTMPLLAAGGGGGGGYSNAGLPGLATNAGGNGNTATSGGGAAGSGGTAPAAAMNWAAGGAGWTSDGAPGGGTGLVACTVAVGGKTPLHGGAGGALGGDANVGAGGFGGGGGGQGRCDAVGGGGGGGYSGGGAGPEQTALVYSGGGGGGSFNSGTNPTNTSGTNTGNGSVTISW